MKIKADCTADSNHYGFQYFFHGIFRNARFRKR